MVNNPFLMVSRLIWFASRFKVKTQRDKNQPVIVSSRIASPPDTLTGCFDYSYCSTEIQFRQSVGTSGVPQTQGAAFRLGHYPGSLQLDKA
jgi:hypothetical protein